MASDKRIKKVRGFELCMFVLLASLFIFLWFCETSNATSQQMKELVEGAKKEGELVYYASMNLKEANTMINRFRKKYPFLKVKLNRTGSSRLLAKVLTEARAKKLSADVVQTLEFSMHTFRKKGILGHYVSSENRFYPYEFKEEGYWITAYYNPYVVAYNTEMVHGESIPKTYKDLLSPRWKGKMMMEGTKVDWFAGMLQIMGREKGLKYMRDLSKQNITLQRGHTLIAQLVAAGEAPLDINIPASSVGRLKKRGAPLDWTALGPVPGIMVGIGIASEAPHPNAAKLYVNFMLSREAQRLLRGFGRSGARSDITQEQPEEIKRIKVVPVNPALAEDINEYARLLREIFSK